MQIFQKELFDKIKLLVEISHENKIFKRGSIGHALLKEQYEIKKKFPVWLHNVYYPVYMNKDNIEIIEEAHIEPKKKIKKVLENKQKTIKPKIKKKK